MFGKKKTTTNNLNKLDKEFFEEDDDFSEEESVNNKKKQETVPERSIVKILLKYIMPSMLALSLGLGLGYVAFHNNVKQSNQPTEVSEVNKQLPLSDVVKSIKDEQIKLLNTQLSSFKKILVKKTDSETNTTTEEEFNAPDSYKKDVGELKNVTDDKIAYEEIAKMKVVASMYESNLKLFDDFFDKLTAIKRYANDSELDSAKKALSEYVKDTSGTMLYNLLKEKSIQKDVEEDGVKSGSPIASLIGGVPNQTSVYLVKIPFITAASQKTYMGEYIVSVSNNKIVYIKYLGYNTIDLKNYLKELKDSLGTFNIKEKVNDSKESKENTEQKQENSEKKD